MHVWRSKLASKWQSLNKLVRCPLIRRVRVRRGVAVGGEQFRFPGLGLVDLLLLDMPVAADLFRQAGDFHRGAVIVGAEPD